MKSAVIVFPGSNCDRDAARALQRLSGKAAAMVWHKETQLPEGLDLVVLPGGFSYGDYLASATVFRHSPKPGFCPGPWGAISGSNFPARMSRLRS